MDLKTIAMKIKKVWIEKGCTACGMCESICPEIFTVEDEATINKEINYTLI
jgi:ferredoxin